MKGLGVFGASSGCHSGTRVERQINTVPADANKNTMVFIWRPKVFIWRPRVFFVSQTNWVFIWYSRQGCLFSARVQGVCLASALSCLFGLALQAIYILDMLICYICYMYCICYIQYMCHICHLGYMGHIYICYRMTPAGRPKHTQPHI